MRPAEQNRESGAGTSIASRMEDIKAKFTPALPRPSASLVALAETDIARYNNELETFFTAYQVYLRRLHEYELQRALAFDFQLQLMVVVMSRRSSLVRLSGATKSGCER
jgi:hypothetical protein